MAFILSIALIILMVSLVVGLISPQKHAELTKKNWSRKTIGLAYGGGILCCFVLLGGVSSSTEPSEPNGVSYQTVENWDKDRLAGRAIVVSKEIDTESELVALGRQLDKETRGKSHAYVFVFTDEAAARLRSKAGSGKMTSAERNIYHANWIGMYSKNETTGHHEIFIHFKGPNDPSQKAIKL
jgi:hypothetical protein